MYLLQHFLCIELNSYSLSFVDKTISCIYTYDSPHTYRHIAMYIPINAHAGSGDIVDGNIKLILGLVWTLILHYQISIGFGLDDDSSGGKKGGMTPKQALLNWLQVTEMYNACLAT